jgi:hypothetical protein
LHRLRCRAADSTSHNVAGAGGLHIAKAIPSRDVPFDPVTDLEVLRDRRVKNALPEGCIIRNRDLFDKEASFWCCDPPPTHRSYNLSFADCILPDTGVWRGMRVDLIFVPYAGCEVEISNSLVLEIVPVQPGETPADPVKPPQLRIAVTPAEARELTLAIRSGKVTVRPHKGQ